MFTLIIVLFIFICLFVKHVRDKKAYFEHLHLPVPEGHALFGHFFYLFQGINVTLQFGQWTRTHGPTYGLWEGSVPRIITTDLSIISDVFTKKFANFHQRREMPLASPNNVDESDEVGMFIARGLRWKRLRAISNPSFTVANLRLVTPLVQECSSELARLVLAHSERQGQVDVYPAYQAYTMHAISRLAFGESRNLQLENHNEYIELAREIFANKHPSIFTTFHFLTAMFPSLNPILLPVFRYLQRFADNKLVQEASPAMIRRLRNKLKALVDERRTKGPTNDETDFIRLFLDAECTPESVQERQLLGLKDNMAKLDTRHLDFDKKLTPEEVVSQCQLFLLAGYDTTSNALAYATYLLATNPHVQDKLLAAIDLMPDTVEPTLDQCAEVDYLDWVMKETLRLYPIAAGAVIRTCQEECSVGSDHLQIKRGQTIQVDVWSLHYDKTIWGADAGDFRPERWRPEEAKHRNPLSWLPFGAGPRICIGVRLAQLELKLALIKLLRAHRVVTTDRTLIPLRVQGLFTISPESVFVKFEKR